MQKAACTSTKRSAGCFTGGVIYFASEDWEQKNGRNPLMTRITAIFLSGNRGALFFQKLVKNGQNFGAEWSGSG
jgi:hypothetical protein